VTPVAMFKFIAVEGDINVQISFCDARKNGAGFRTCLKTVQVQIAEDAIEDFYRKAFGKH